MGKYLVLAMDRRPLLCFPVLFDGKHSEKGGRSDSHPKDGEPSLL